MVDVSGKEPSDRKAVARAVVRMEPATAAAVAAGDAPKGDVLASARIAGIMAAKRTAELIPLCHPLGLDHLEVDGVIDAEAGTIELEVDPIELDHRKKRWEPRTTNFGSGAIWKFAQGVGPACNGAVTHPGEKGETHVYADI